MDEEYEGVGYQWVMIGLSDLDAGASEQQRDELRRRLDELWDQYDES